MKLTENSPLTNGSASLKVQSKFAKFVFHIYAAIANAADAAALITALSGLKISLTKNTSGGEVVRINERPFLDIAEIAASNEGAVRVATASGYTRLKCSIEVAAGGNVLLGTDEFFTLKLLSIPANVFVDVYATEVTKSGAYEYDIKTDKVFADSPKDSPAEMVTMLAIPKSTLKQLTLKTTSGQVIYLPDEVEQICSEVNPQSFLKQGLTTAGSENFYVLDISKFSKYRVDVTADSTLYIVKPALNN